MSAGINYHLAKPTSDLGYLAPGFRAAVDAAIADCQASQLDAKVYETYRSNELQAVYYTRGRTVTPPTKPVTNAMTNLYSWHGYGLAVDVIHRVKEWDIENDWFAKVAEIFKKHGCKWGGDWTTKDRPHFQWGLCKASPSDTARQIITTQGVSAVWQAVGALAPTRPEPPMSEATMSTSVFKGAIQGGEIAVQFQSDSNNADADLLVQSYSETGGANPETDHSQTAPGGSAATKLQPTKAGIMEVWVVIGTETDKGQLTVRRNGTVVDNEPIRGSVRWVYTIDPA